MLAAIGFNLADVAVVAFLALFAVLGFRKGLIRMMTRLVSTLGALIAAFLLARPLAAWLAGAGGMFGSIRDSIRDFFLERADRVDQSIGTTVTNMNLPGILRKPLEESLDFSEPLSEGAEQLAQTVFQYLLTAVAAILIFIAVILLFRLVGGTLNALFEKIGLLRAANRMMGFLLGLVHGILLLLLVMAVIGLASPLMPGLSETLRSSLIARYFYDFNQFLSLFSRLGALVSGRGEAV